MSDYSEFLLRAQGRLRVKTGLLISATTLLREYNVGGREFADVSHSIRDTWLCKVATTCSMIRADVTDAANTFSRLTIDAALGLYRYKIAKAVRIDTIRIIGKDSRSMDKPLRRLSTEDFDRKGGTDPNNTIEYPGYWHPFLFEQFELRPFFSKGTDADPFYLLCEGRRRWIDLDGSTVVNCALPDEWKEAPVEFAIWKCALEKREYDVAAEARDTYFGYIAAATGQKWETDFAADHKRPGPVRKN